MSNAGAESAGSDSQEYMRDTQTQFVPQEGDGEVLWAVIEITGEKGKFYKVRWAGVDPETGKPWAQSWVPKSDCTDDLVVNWKRQQALKKKKKDGAKASKKSRGSAASSVLVSRGSTASSSTTTRHRKRLGNATTGANKTGKRTHSSARSDDEDLSAVEGIIPPVRPSKKRRLDVPEREELWSFEVHKAGKRKIVSQETDEEEAEEQPGRHIAPVGHPVEPAGRVSQRKGPAPEKEKEEESLEEDKGPPVKLRTATSKAIPKANYPVRQQTPTEPAYVEYKSGKITGPKKRWPFLSTDSTPSSSDEGDATTPHFSSRRSRSPVLSQQAMSRLKEFDQEMREVEQAADRMYDEYVDFDGVPSHSSAKPQQPKNQHRMSNATSQGEDDSHPDGIVPETETEQSQSQSQSKLLPLPPAELPASGHNDQPQSNAEPESYLEQPQSQSKLLPLPPAELPASDHNDHPQSDAEPESYLEQSQSQSQSQSNLLPLPPAELPASDHNDHPQSDAEPESYLLELPTSPHADRKLLSKPSRTPTVTSAEPRTHHTPARSSLIRKMKSRTGLSTQSSAIRDDVVANLASPDQLGMTMEVDPEEGELDEDESQEVDGLSSQDEEKEMLKRPLTQVARRSRSGTRTASNSEALRPIPMLSPSKFAPHLPKASSSSSSSVNGVGLGGRSGKLDDKRDAEEEILEIFSSIEQFSSPEKGGPRRGSSAAALGEKGKGKAWAMRLEAVADTDPDDDGDDEMDRVVRERGQELAERARQERKKRRRETAGEVDGTKKRTLSELLSANTDAKNRDRRERAQEKERQKMKRLHLGSAALEAGREKEREIEQRKAEKEKERERERERERKREAIVQREQEEEREEEREIERRKAEKEKEREHEREAIAQREEEEEREKERGIERRKAEKKEREREAIARREEEEESTQDVLAAVTDVRPMEDVDNDMDEPEAGDGAKFHDSDVILEAGQGTITDSNGLGSVPIVPVTITPRTTPSPPTDQRSFELSTNHKKTATSLSESLLAVKAELAESQASLDAALASLANSEMRAADLARGKESAEKDREFFREQYAKASEFVTSVREENKELENQAHIAKEQATAGVEMVKATFAARTKALEDDLKHWRRIAMFMMEKDVRTNDDIRRRAAEEPELRLQCEKLEEENFQLRGEIYQVQAGADDKVGALEARLMPLIGHNARLKKELSDAKAKLERRDRDEEDGLVSGSDMVYRCQWRSEGGSTVCEDVFSKIQDLEDHMYQGGHLHV